MKKYIRHHFTHLAGAILCVLTGNAFAVILQFIKGDVLDYALTGNIAATLRCAGWLIGFILLEVFFTLLYNRLAVRFSLGCAKDLKADLFSRILQKSYVEWKKQPQGEYLAKYTNETELIRQRYFSMLPMFFEIVLKVVFVSIALFSLDWRIALVTLFLLTMPLYVPKLIAKPLQKAQSDYLETAQTVLARLKDWLSGFELIKNYSIESHVRRQFCRINEEAMEKQLSDAQLGIWARLISTLMSYLSWFIILAFSAYLVLCGDFSAGDFFVAIGMIDQLSWPLISLSDILRQLVAVRPACRSMAQFMEAAESSGDGNHKGHLSQSAEYCHSAPPKTGAVDSAQKIPAGHTVCFRDVTFSYEPQRPILRHVSLTLEKGKRYLITGPSGCGKSTLLNLLLRYYAADAGEITVDGQPLEQIEDPFRIFTVVRQEATLFCDTLRNNLTMYQDVPDEKLTGLLCSLGLAKYASPAALNEMVLEGGSNFSGGEKKRFCLARALLRDTPVLLCDEPLANLDSDTAQKIESLLLSIPEKTLVVVSHQCSEENLQAFDRVIDFGG